MPERLKAHLMVLWEHELREAAASLTAFFEASNEAQELPDEKVNELARVALVSCGRALHGVEDDAALVVSTMPTPGKSASAWWVRERAKR